MLKGAGQDAPMLVSPHMATVTALANDACVWPDGAVCVKLLRAVRLVVIFALSAVEAAVALGAHAHALADLDQRHLWADRDGGADDFCEEAVAGSVSGAAEGTTSGITR